MTNPYDGGYAPYEPSPNPYEPNRSEPNPFGQPSPAPVRRTDGVSVAALICSLTCCAAPVGIGLGIAGIVRTKDGRRSGRWAAITGLALGIAALVLGVAFFAFAVFMGSRTVWEYEAKVGQCMDLDFLGDPIKASCGAPHAGEIIWVGEFDAARAEAFDPDTADDFCHDLPGLDPVYASAIESGDYDVSVESDGSSEHYPDSGDLFFCYVERADGDTMDGPIADGGSTTGA